MKVSPLLKLAPVCGVLMKVACPKAPVAAERSEAKSTKCLENMFVNESLELGRNSALYTIAAPH